MAGISWVASYPKSGNTWVRLFLASYRNKGNSIIPNALPREYEYADTQDEHYHAVSPYPVDKLTESEVLQLRGAVLIKILTDCRTRPLFVKTHNARIVFEEIKLIPDLFTAESIYVIRDPRDACISFAEWSNISIDDAITMMQNGRTVMRSTSVRPLVHVIGHWSAHVKSWQKPDTLIVRYEDMHADPERTFGGILEHVGIDVVRSHLRKALKTVGFARLQEAEKEAKFFECPPNVERFFTRGTAGHWKEILTEGQARRLRLAHGDVMEEFGYG